MRLILFLEKKFIKFQFFQVKPMSYSYIFLDHGVTTALKLEQHMRRVAINMDRTKTRKRPSC